MKIKLGIGLGPINFGMKQLEIIKILGPPDNIKLDKDYKGREPMHQYNAINTRVTYYKNENHKLGYIRSSNSDLCFKKTKIINKPDSALSTIFSKLKFERKAFDFWVDFFNEENWLLIRSEYGKINEIELGIPFIEGSNDKYNWP